MGGVFGNGGGVLGGGERLGGGGRLGGDGGLGGGPRGWSAAVTHMSYSPLAMRSTIFRAVVWYKACVDDGDVAIALSVVRLTPPKPTAMILVPAFLAVVAAEMAVLSLPPTVCTPSDIRISTFGTPVRAPVPVSTA